MVKVQIAPVEEPVSSPSEQSCAPSRSSVRIEDMMHHAELGITTISIIVNIVETIVISRHLSEPGWLSSFRRITPYSLWAGLLLVFAGIVVRDRSLGKPPILR